MSTPLNHRVDFVYLFDVVDGNPNGDPDAGNLPRIDPETGEGIVTDVCLKRKIRNYVLLSKGDQPPFAIYVKERAILNQAHQQAYQVLGLGHKLEKSDDKESKITAEDVAQVRAYMCRTFFDIRTFGAVMSTRVNAGQVRGPVQLTFGRSIGPIVTLEHTITRMAATDEAEAGKERTMGRKSTVPYGLYRAHGFVSAHLARDTGFSQDDLSLLWDALLQMFDHDRSAARGMMSARGLFVFAHDSLLGNAPAHLLFRKVVVTRKNEVPRSFDDFMIDIDISDLPAGVSFHRLLG